MIRSPFSNRNCRNLVQLIFISLLLGTTLSTFFLWLSSKERYPSRAFKQGNSRWCILIYFLSQKDQIRIKIKVGDDSKNLSTHVIESESTSSTDSSSKSRTSVVISLLWISIVLFKSTCIRSSWSWRQCCCSLFLLLQEVRTRDYSFFSASFRDCKIPSKVLYSPSKQCTKCRISWTDSL